MAWQGVVAPAGTPRPIVDELAQQIGRLLTDSVTPARFETAALEPLPPSPPIPRAEVDDWAIIVRNSGAELE